MRRLPAALYPSSRPVSGLTNTPLRLPGYARHPVASSARAWRAAKRRCIAERCVRLPLRGQHRLARLRGSRTPCFPFNCACRNARASTETRASVGSGAGPRQGERRPRSLCYRMRRVRCSHAQSAHAVKRETGGGASPGLCCPRNGTPPARCALCTRPCRPRCHCPSAGGKAAAWQAASPDTGRHKGRAPRSPNARSAGDGECARCHPPATGASFRSVMSRHFAGRPRAAVSSPCPVSSRRAPCCAQ